MEKRTVGIAAQHSEAQLCIIVGFEDADIPPLTLQGSPVALLLVDNRPLLQHMLYFWRLFGYDDFVVICPPSLRARIQEMVERWISRQDEPSGLEGARILVFSETVSKSAGTGGMDFSAGGVESSSAGSVDNIDNPAARNAGKHSGSKPGEEVDGSMVADRERRTEAVELDTSEGDCETGSSAILPDTSHDENPPSPDPRPSYEFRQEETAFTTRSRPSGPSEEEEITSISTLRAAIRAGCFNCDNVILLSGSLFVTVLPPLLLRYHREAKRACTVLLSNIISPFRCNVAPDFTKCDKGCLVLQEYGSGSPAGVLATRDIHTVSRHQNFPLECVMVRRGLEKHQLADAIQAQQQVGRSEHSSPFSGGGVGKEELAVAAHAVNTALEIGFRKLYYQPGVGAVESKSSLLNYLPLNLSPEEIMHSLGVSGTLTNSMSTSMLSAISTVNRFAAPTTVPPQELEVMRLSAQLQGTSRARQAAAATTESLRAFMVPPAYPLQCGKLTFYENLIPDMLQDQEEGFLVLPLDAPREDSTLRVYEQRIGLAIFKLSILSVLVQIDGVSTVFDEMVRFLIEQEHLPTAERHPLLRGSPDTAHGASPKGIGKVIAQAPFRAGAGADADAILSFCPYSSMQTGQHTATSQDEDCDAYNSLAKTVQIRYAAKAEGERIISELVHTLDDTPYPDPFSEEAASSSFQLASPPAGSRIAKNWPPLSPLTPEDMRMAVSGVAFVETRGSPLLRLPVVCCLVSDSKSYTMLNYALHHGAISKLPMLSPVFRSTSRDSYRLDTREASIIGRECNFMRHCALVQSTVDAYCHFGRGVHLENCILGRNVTVSYNVHLENCILKDHVIIHSGSFLVGCILESGAEVGRRCRLRNCMAGPNAGIREDTVADGMMFAK